jgi:hypothetical protein
MGRALQPKKRPADDRFRRPLVPVTHSGAPESPRIRNLRGKAERSVRAMKPNNLQCNAMPRTVETDNFCNLLQTIATIKWPPRQEYRGCSTLGIVQTELPHRELRNTVLMRQEL